MRIVRSGADGFAGRTGRNPEEAGNAMVVALLVLMVLTAAGVAYVAVTKTEKQIAGNSMIATQALYAAESGITEGLHRMSFPAESTSYIGPSGAPTAGWGRYIVIRSGASALDPDRPALASDGMDNDEDGQVDETGEQFPEALTKQTVNASALRYPYVRVEYKTQGGQLVRFGDADENPLTPPMENASKGPPVLRITARGMQGAADKTLEAEAVRFPAMEVGAALWCGGPVKMNGNAFLVDGNDHYATAPHDTVPGAGPMPALLTGGPTSDADISATQQDNVMGEGGMSSVQHSTFAYDFNSIWSEYKSMADYSFTGPIGFSASTPTYGTLDDPRVTVVDGNLDCTGPWVGGGVLVVNGNLTMGGESQFTGIVIVLGDIKLGGGGPADVAHVIGGMIYQGTMIGDSKVSGSARIFYSSEAVNAAQSVHRYTLSWWRER